MFTNKYPYTDFHELNADWLLRIVKDLDAKLNGALDDYVREQLGDLFVDVTYDAPTETLLMNVNMEG